MITYGDIFKEFCDATNLQNMVENYRPCDEMFGVPFIPGAIIVWLNNGSKLIYISKETK